MNSLDIHSAGLPALPALPFGEKGVGQGGGAPQDQAPTGQRSRQAWLREMERPSWQAGSSRSARRQVTLRSTTPRRRRAPCKPVRKVLLRRRLHSGSLRCPCPGRPRRARSPRPTPGPPGLRRRRAPRRRWPRNLPRPGGGWPFGNVGVPVSAFGPRPVHERLLCSRGCLCRRRCRRGVGIGWRGRCPRPCQGCVRSGVAAGICGIGDCSGPSRNRTRGHASAHPNGGADGCALVCLAIRRACPAGRARRRGPGNCRAWRRSAFDPCVAIAGTPLGRVRPRHCALAGCRTGTRHAHACAVDGARRAAVAGPGR